MRTSMAIIRRYLRDIVRRRSTILFMIFLPLLFTFIFGVVPGFAGDTVNIAVVDSDHTKVSQALIRILQKTPGYDIVKTNPSDARALIRNQQASYIIGLPKGLERQALRGGSIHVIITPAPNEVGAAQGDSQTILNLQTELGRVALAGAAEARRTGHQGVDGHYGVQAYITGMAHATQIPTLAKAHGELLQSGIGEGVLSSGQQSVVGFATMFIIFAVVGQAGNLFHEKRSGTWDRLKASGSSKVSIVAGYGGGLFVTGWLQFGIMYAAGRWLFGIYIPLGAWTAVVTSLYILAIAGIALCMLGFVKTEQQLSSMGSLLAVVTSMIGGAYWPLDLEPTWMQHVAWFVPQNWAIDAFRLIAVGGGGWSVLGLPIGVLAVFALVFFGVGVTQLRYA